MKFVTEKKSQGAWIVRIEGELDAATIAELRPATDAVVAEQPTQVEVDLSRLRLIDSSGVGLLVSLHKRLRAAGATVTFVGVANQPLAIFKLLRLDKVLSMSDTPAPVKAP